MRLTQGAYGGGGTTGRGLVGVVLGRTSAGGMVEIHGFEELDAKLKRLSRGTAGKIMRRSLRAGAKIIAAEARARAPRQTGRLAKSIKVRAASTRKRGEVAIVVRTGQSDNLFVGDTYYGAFQEFGTDYTLRKPFLQPAFEAGKQQAVNVIRQTVSAGIVREATR